MEGQGMHTGNMIVGFEVWITGREAVGWFGYGSGFDMELLDCAVFYRLSQPAEPIRWAKMALITDDKFTEHAKKLGEKPHK